ncbi:ABC transporter substrate-binding protein [Ornithinimicrobium faecis]|uniref:ABC transporter substrate-binding protein n=1 Tax=Ornithinimicrobium faecis TaxID=2934158 RepID=UPI0021191C36|nr:ABC transporter substrate-binding protein [Ornithinimicrobium sp. HY1745]
MPTTTRRLTTVALAGALLFAAGCAGKEERDGGEGGFAGGGETVTVGLIAPMTGPFAVLGISQKNSLQVEVDAINEAGGLGGSQVEIQVRDSGLDPGKAVQQANEFSGDDSVKLVVGPSLTSFYNAAKGSFEQGKTVNCQPAVGAGTFADLDYGFRSQDPNDLDVDMMLSYLEAEGVTSIGLIYEADDTGNFFDEELETKAPDYGIDYVGMQENRADDASHTPYVQALSDADAIWISSNASGSKTMAAAAQEGYQGQLVGASGLQNISFIEAAGEDAAGVVFAAANYEWPVRDRDTWRPGYRKHIEAVEEQYGVNVGPKSGATSPKGTSIAGDCVYAWSKGVEAAESFDAAEVATAIENLDLSSDETPSGSTITPGDSHEFYNEDDIHIYQWNVDDEGWYLEEVTPES